MWEYRISKLTKAELDYIGVIWPGNNGDNEQYRHPFDCAKTPIAWPTPIPRWCWVATRCSRRFIWIGRRHFTIGMDSFACIKHSYTRLRWSTRYQLAGVTSITRPGFQHFNFVLIFVCCCSLTALCVSINLLISMAQYKLNYIEIYHKRKFYQTVSIDSFIRLCLHLGLVSLKLSLLFCN